MILILFSNESYRSDLTLFYRDKKSLLHMACRGCTPLSLIAEFLRPQRSNLSY